MKTTKDYKVGQRVKMYDTEDKCNVYGHVIEVRPDEILRLSSIVIKWNDMNDPCEHFPDEFEKIKQGIPE